MFPHFPPPLLPTTASLLVVLLPLLAFVLIAFTNYRKRLTAVLNHGSAQAQMKLSSKVGGDPFFSPLIDKPADQPIGQEFSEMHSGNYSEDDVMVMADEDECFLLKSAEHVVEQIQSIVDDIATGPSPLPANPEEVFTKIRAIVSQYPIFENTEYYDAINNFVAVTVQRDCDLSLTPDDLKGLWWPEAA